MTDPYETLGVLRSASSEEITAAWRSLAQKHHPDKGGDPQLMRDINEAYMAIGDPTARAAWDLANDPQAQLDKLAREQLLRMFAVLIRDPNEDLDLVRLLYMGLDKQMEGLVLSRRQTLKELAMLERRAAQLRGPVDNFLDEALQKEIKSGREHLPVYDKDEAVYRRATELLADFGWTARDPRWAGPGSVRLLSLEEMRALGFKPS